MFGCDRLQGRAASSSGKKVLNGPWGAASGPFRPRSSPPALSLGLATNPDVETSSRLEFSLDDYAVYGDHPVIVEPMVAFDPWFSRWVQNTQNP